jgi:hypothetical protein
MFKIGMTVVVDDCYLNDEVGLHASKFAIVKSEPTDNEELVCVEYTDGSIDYLPQDILTGKKD